MSYLEKNEFKLRFFATVYMHTHSHRWKLLPRPFIHFGFFPSISVPTYQMCFFAQFIWNHRYVCFSHSFVSCVHSDHLCFRSFSFLYLLYVPMLRPSEKKKQHQQELWFNVKIGGWCHGVCECVIVAFPRTPFRVSYIFRIAIQFEFGMGRCFDG